VCFFFIDSYGRGGGGVGRGLGVGAIRFFPESSLARGAPILSVCAENVETFFEKPRMTKCGEAATKRVHIFETHGNLAWLMRGKSHVAAHAGAGAVSSHNSEMVSMVCS
jgi:hypothetical protein